MGMSCEKAKSDCNCESILGGESTFGLLNTTDWLKKINYPDPFPIKWF